MAKQNIRTVLGKMWTASQRRYARKGVDKMPVQVLATIENIAEGLKYGYGLAQQKTGRLPFIDDSVFHDAAIIFMQDLKNIIKSNSKFEIKTEDRLTVSFVQPAAKLKTNDPTIKAKKTAKNFIEKYINLKFNTAEERAFMMGLTRQHGSKLTGSTQEAKPLTVGMMQLVKTLEGFQTVTGFEGFFDSNQAKDIQEKFDTQLYFETEGTGTQRKFSIQKSVKIGIVLMSNEYNRPGDAPADWIHVKPHLEDAIFSFAKTQDWYKMKGSPSMEDEDEDKIIDSVTAEITNGKNIKAAKGPKRKSRRVKDKRIFVRKKQKNVLKKSNLKAPELSGKSSKFDLNTIIATINLRLAGVLQDNMQAPRLVYRTGRFASTVTANATFTPKGNVSIGYNYMRYPYATFAPGGKMYTPQRNPIPLIEMSIREIASDLAIGRYGVRRT